MNLFLIIKRFIKKNLNKKIFFLLRNFYTMITGDYITSKPLGSLDIYLNQHNQEINKNYFQIDNFFKLRKKDIKFINKLAFITQNNIKSVNSNFQHGKIIYKTLFNYIKKNKLKKINLIDIGTAKGFSAIVMSKVIYETKTKGKVHTIDIIPHNRKIYWNAPSDHQFGKITREFLLKKFRKFLKNIIFYHGESTKIINQLTLNRVNFAFIDGSHDYDDVKNEFTMISKLQQKGDILIFDDCTKGFYDGVYSLIKNLKKKKLYKCKIIQSSINRGYAICYKN